VSLRVFVELVVGFCLWAGLVDLVCAEKQLCSSNALVGVLRAAGARVSGVNR